MARPNFFQRRYLVQKEFQGKFIVLYLILVCTVVGLATWSLFVQIETAVESHLYRTHIRIDRVGDFLVDLMFRVNFYAILGIVLIVLIASLLVFRGINRTFQKMDRVIAAMAEGNFDIACEKGTPFTEVGDLRHLLEQARTQNKARYTRLETAIGALEMGINNHDIEQLEKGRIELDLVLREVSL